MVDNTSMEVSSQYQTHVNQSRYQLSSHRLGSVFTQQPLPLDFLLSTDLSLISQQLATSRIHSTAQENGNLFGSFQNSGNRTDHRQKQSRDRKHRNQRSLPKIEPNTARSY